MYPGPAIRDRITATARRDLLSIQNQYLYEHQAEFLLALEGKALTTETVDTWEHDPAVNVRAEREAHEQETFDIQVCRYEAYRPILNARGDQVDEDRRIVTSDDYWVLQDPDDYLENGPTWRIDDSVAIPDLIERRVVIPRDGGVARRASVLTGFSGGKSWFLGRPIVAPMMLCPGALIDLIGMNYDAAEPEFTYICDALFSESGFNIPLDKPKFPGIHKVRFTKPRPGVMPEVVLSNGAHLRVVSYENRENLKGKKRDCYVYAEYYQFPGFASYSDIAQNLDKEARQGFAFFATTPDAAHVETLVELGQSPQHTNWHVTTAVPRTRNKHAFTFAQMEEDRTTKTREKFKIGQLGMIGEYIGSAFNYKRGTRTFSPKTHPRLWHNPRGQAVRDNLKIPDNWTIVGGADTGSVYAGVVAAFDDANPPNMYILDECNNYRYVATEIEKSDTMTLSQWYRDLRAMSVRYGGNCTFWVDSNAQMKHDAAVSCGVALMASHRGVEERTEIFREHFQNNRIWFAPWLEVVPYECEIARFPPGETSTGVWRRVKEKDHSLDCCEHMASQRPTGKPVAQTKKKLWIEEHLGIDPVHDATPDNRYFG